MLTQTPPRGTGLLDPYQREGTDGPVSSRTTAEPLAPWGVCGRPRHSVHRGAALGAAGPPAAGTARRLGRPGYGGGPARLRRRHLGRVALDLAAGCRTS